MADCLRLEAHPICSKMAFRTVFGGVMCIQRVYFRSVARHFSGTRRWDEFSLLKPQFP